MQKLLLMVAACGLSAPAMAQTTSQQPAQAQANATSTAQTKMVRKQVCEKVAVERSTGSRLNSTTRVCKIVEVPAPVNGSQPAGNAAPSNGY